MRARVAVLVTGLSWSCGGGKEAATDGSRSAGGALDSGAMRDSGGPVDPICVDAPVVTWDSWGQGFLGATCQSCHRSTSPDRNGAPVEVSFDDRDSALGLAERILARSTGPEPTMPPGGGVTEDDRYKLEVWLTCWE